MARPIKNGLDYFPFDVQFFSDDKIVAVSVEYGLKGEISVVKLLCAIYRQGYFIEWNESIRIRLLKELPGVSADLLDKVVHRLIEWGFFDQTLSIRQRCSLPSAYRAATSRLSAGNPIPVWNICYIMVKTIDYGKDRKIKA